MKDPHDKSTRDMIAAALNIETEDARRVGSVGYMARALVAATMPHSAVDGPWYRRTSGTHTLTLAATHPEIALPWGSMPRLILAWLATEAVKRQERTLPLGPTLAAFMREFGMPQRGGQRGTVGAFRDHAARLFACAITCERRHLSPAQPDGRQAERERSSRFLIASANDSERWFEPLPDGGRVARGWSGTVTLSEEFYREVTEHAVPVDLRVLVALRRSPMAIDQYLWLTYRLHAIQRPTLVPWEALAAQFGAGYPIETARGLADFRRRFRGQMRRVLALYSTARVVDNPDGLELRPSPSSVGPLRRPPPALGGVDDPGTSAG